MDWELTKNIVTSIQSVVTSIAIVVGAAWAYRRFRLFRTLKPKLDFSFEFNQFSDGQEGHITIVELKVRNKGNTHVHLRKNGSHMCLLKYGLVDATSAAAGVALISKRRKQLEPIDQVFTAHKWIEPNETIDDVKILRTPAGNSVAIQLELVILGKQAFSSSTAFPLTGDTATAKFTSEDEEDELDDTQLATSVIMAKLALAKALVTPSLPENKKSEISALVDTAESLLNRLTSTSSADKKLLKQSWELVQRFDKHLD